MTKTTAAIAIADGEYTLAKQHLFQALALLENSDDPVATPQVVEVLAQLTAPCSRRS